MTNTLAWHSTLATDRPVYHDDTRCPEGGTISLQNRRPGDGGRDPCPRCARYSHQEKRGTPIPACRRFFPESADGRCPYCRSYLITPLGQVTAGGIVVKEVHGCDVCKTAFLVVHRENG
jgi:hypothetical protein